MPSSCISSEYIMPLTESDYCYACGHEYDGIYQHDMMCENNEIEVNEAMPDDDWYEHNRVWLPESLIEFKKQQEDVMLQELREIEYECLDWEQREIEYDYGAWDEFVRIVEECEAEKQFAVDADAYFDR